MFLVLTILITNLVADILQKTLTTIGNVNPAKVVSFIQYFILILKIPSTDSAAKEAPTYDYHFKFYIGQVGSLIGTIIDIVY